MSTKIQNYSKGVNRSVLNSSQKPLALEWKLQYTLKDPLDECAFYVLVLALTTIKACSQKMSKNALKRNWIEHSRPSLISRTYMYTIYLIHDVLDKRSC